MSHYLLAGSPAAATGTEPDEPEHNVEELTESIQSFAEEQLDAHAAAVRAALEALESAKEQLDAAVASAREAQLGWERTPAIERGEMLHEAARRIRERTAELAELLHAADAQLYRAKRAGRNQVA